MYRTLTITETGWEAVSGGTQYDKRLRITLDRLNGLPEITELEPANLGIPLPFPQETQIWFAIMDPARADSISATEIVWTAGGPFPGITVTWALSDPYETNDAFAPLLPNWNSDCNDLLYGNLAKGIIIPAIESLLPNEYMVVSWNDFLETDDWYRILVGWEPGWPTTRALWDAMPPHLPPTLKISRSILPTNAQSFYDQQQYGITVPVMTKGRVMLSPVRGSHCAAETYFVENPPYTIPNRCVEVTASGDVLLLEPPVAAPLTNWGNLSAQKTVLLGKHPNPATGNNCPCV